MPGLHENQHRILDYLLDHPEGATLEELAEHLGLSKTGTKEHLLKVESQGYLQHSDAKGSVGRPRRRYLLSAAGIEVFPRQYSWLSNALLELLAEDLGAEKVAKIMRDLANKVCDSMEPRFSRLRGTPELLAEVTAVMNELGYRAALKQSDLRKGAVLEATNCVYHSVAQQHPELCKFDVQFIARASKMDVTLESCIARGGSVCRFCLHKPQPTQR
ncbi:MAG TPA: winged helix-turn-helix transcriptional regulator [bacterium]|nr:winged helix-turn-helix transcriptional regulator [bacterium]